jgi:hypothetical protein
VLSSEKKSSSPQSPTTRRGQVIKHFSVRRRLVSLNQSEPLCSCAAK